MTNTTKPTDTAEPAGFDSNELFEHFLPGSTERSELIAACAAGDSASFANFVDALRADMRRARQHNNPGTLPKWAHEFLRQFAREYTAQLEREAAQRLAWARQMSGR